VLRSNPFRNYSPGDLELIAKDPLEGLQVLPRATKSRSAAAVGTKKVAAEGGKERKPSSKSASSAAAGGSKAATTSAPASSADGARKSRYPPMMNPPDTSGLDTKPKERVAVNLREIYPSKEEEFSPEEVRARKRRDKYDEEDVQRWNGWEWAEAFDKEMQTTRREFSVFA
jgi:checkpoint serine/threonine-protein kinase